MIITRCPACGTMFNVVADQLKVSQGWVRCGQCSDVFDASMHLQDEQEFQDVLHGSQAGNATQAINTPPITEVTANPADEADLEDDFESSLRAAVMASTAAKERGDEREEVPPSLPPPAVVAPAVKSSLTQSPGSLLNEEIKAEESAAAANGVSFVQHARRQAFWKKLWVRVALAFVAILLLVGLLLQIVLQQKDHLVLLEPRLQPTVQALCSFMECELGPLRKIDAVVIDSSTFTKLGTDSYKLSFSIKNLGAIAVAMPSLEVTLTDTQDQAVIRRVLAPAQFGASAALLAAAADFQGAVVLDVSASALPGGVGSPNSRVAGYRLLAFYP